MEKSLRLGVFLDHSLLSDGRYTVTQEEALKFIEALNLGESITQAASIIQVEKINPENYNIVLEQRDITVIRFPSWKNATENVLSLFCEFKTHFAKARLFVESCDIIWLRIPSMICLFFWWIAKKKRKPLIIHVVSNLLLGPKRSKYRGLVKVLARCFFYIYHIIVKMMARYGLVFSAGERLKEIYSTPLHPVFPIDDVLIKEKDIIPPKVTKGQAKHILFVGRFAHGKGVEILIDAIDILKSEFGQICLIMAGDGMLLEEVRRLVETRGLKKNVKLPGFVSSKRYLQALYEWADIAVLPSDSYPEGLPRVISEFWASGLPLIATRISGIPYRVKEGVNGLLVTPGSLDELLEALRRLIKDSELRFRLAKGGNQAVRKFTFERQTYYVKRLVEKYYPQLYPSVTN